MSSLIVESHQWNLPVPPMGLNSPTDGIPRLVCTPAAINQAPCGNKPMLVTRKEMVKKRNESPKKTKKPHLFTYLSPKASPVISMSINHLQRLVTLMTIFSVLKN